MHNFEYFLLNYYINNENCCFIVSKKNFKLLKMSHQLILTNYSAEIKQLLIIMRQIFSTQINSLNNE